MEPLSAASYKVQFTASRVLKDKLDRARELLSHANPSGDLAVLVERAMDALIAELEKNPRGKTKKPRASKGSKRGTISRAVRREVFERDGEQCGYVSATGQRCQDRAFLEIDHDLAKGRGGSDETKNRRVRCKAHNGLHAEQTFGRAHVEKAISVEAEPPGAWSGSGAGAKCRLGRGKRALAKVTERSGSRSATIGRMRSWGAGVGLGLALVAAAACGSGSESPSGVGGSGGGGGAGGSAGSSGGAGGASGTATYGAVCDAVESLSCWTGECDDYAQDTLDQAAEAGCTSQALAAFDCFADHTPICDANLGFVEDPACTAATDAYLTCLRGGGACEQAGFLGKCAVFCGTAWGAACDLDPDGSNWACHCRIGPKLGTTFTLPAIDKCDEALSAAQCAP